jgi:hypothetical protein
MWRDPLDELIEELERIVPAKAAKPAFDPADFQAMSDRLDRESARERAQQHPRAEVAASAIATASAVWPVRPARRPDPSAPWDYTGHTDADDSEG